MEYKNAKKKLRSKIDHYKRMCIEADSDSFLPITSPKLLQNIVDILSHVHHTSIVCNARKPWRSFCSGR